MRTFTFTEQTELAAGRAAQAAADIGRRVVRKERLYGPPRPRSLSLADMRCLARLARRVAADLTVFAVHVERTIGDRR